MVFIAAVETLRHLHHFKLPSGQGFPFLLLASTCYFCLMSCIFLLLSDVERLLSLCVDHLIICLLRSVCLRVLPIFYLVDFFFFLLLSFCSFLIFWLLTFQRCNLQYLILFYVISFDCDDYFLFPCRIILV